MCWPNGQQLIHQVGWDSANAIKESRNKIYTENDSEAKIIVETPATGEKKKKLGVGELILSFNPKNL